MSKSNLESRTWIIHDWQDPTPAGIMKRLRLMGYLIYIYLSDTNINWYRILFISSTTPTWRQIPESITSAKKTENARIVTYILLEQKFTSQTQT